MHLRVDSVSHRGHRHTQTAAQSANLGWKHLSNIFGGILKILFSVWRVDLSRQQLAHGHDAERVAHEHGDDGEERDEAELGAAEGGGVQAAGRGAQVGEGGDGEGRHRDHHRREHEQVPPAGVAQHERCNKWNINIQYNHNTIKITWSCAD